MAAVPRYLSSPAVYGSKPISYFSTQYEAISHSPNGLNLFPPNSTSSTATLSTFHQAQPSPFALSVAPPSPMKHGVALNAVPLPVPSPLTASQSQSAVQRLGKKEAETVSGRHHARNSSLSISYIQQKQSAFFSDGDGANYAAPLVDDDLYDEHKGSKSRNETEDVWCCTVCTFWNNLLLPQCELCGANKSANARIIKVECIDSVLVPGMLLEQFETESFHWLHLIVIRFDEWMMHHLLFSANLRFVFASNEWLRKRSSRRDRVRRDRVHHRLHRECYHRTMAF